MEDNANRKYNKYKKLYFKTFNRDEWYYTYLYCDQVDDRLRLSPKGEIWRHPYSLQDKSYILTKWVVPSYAANQKGYLQFSWHNHTLQVHTVVAEAFVEKTGYDPDGAPWKDNVKLEVDHIDENIWNNEPANLRWVSSDWNKRNTLRRDKQDFWDDERGIDINIDENGEIVE